MIRSSGHVLPDAPRERGIAPRQEDEVVDVRACHAMRPVPFQPQPVALAELLSTFR